MSGQKKGKSSPEFILCVIIINTITHKCDEIYEIMVHIFYDCSMIHDISPVERFA